MVCVWRSAWTVSTLAALHPGIPKLSETTREVGFRYFSRFGLSRAFELVSRYSVTTSAGLRSTFSALALMILTWAPNPSAVTFFSVDLHSTSEISIPTELALNFWAAVITIRPSPEPRSYTTSPGLIRAASSIRSTTIWGLGMYGARSSDPKSCAGEDQTTANVKPRRDARIASLGRRACFPPPYSKFYYTRHDFGPGAPKIGRAADGVFRALEELHR